MKHKIEDFSIGDIVSFENNNPQQNYFTNHDNSQELIKDENIFHGGFKNYLQVEGFTGEVMDITKNYIVVRFKGIGQENRDYLQLGYRPESLTIVSNKEPKEHLLTNIL